MSLGLRPPNFAAPVAAPGVVAAGVVGVCPKADPGVARVEPNALLENGVAGAGAPPPKAEPLAEPKGLGADPSVVPVPNALLDVEPNGELEGAGAGGAAPKGDLFSEVLDDMLADAPLDAGGAEPNGDSPPKGDFDAPSDAVMFPKPNDVPADGVAADVDAGLLSNGLEVLYFWASLENNSGSRPLYFSNVLPTSDIFCGLCFW